MPLDDSDYHILGLRPHSAGTWRNNARIRAILDQMTKAAFGNAKELNALFESLLSAVGLDQQEAHRLVAKAFAIAARQETCIIRRSRLYKLACRHVPVDVVAEKFVYMRVKVNPPRLYVHTKHTKLIASPRPWPPAQPKGELLHTTPEHSALR